MDNVLWLMVWYVVFLIRMVVNTYYTHKKHINSISSLKFWARKTVMLTLAGILTENIGYLMNVLRGQTTFFWFLFVVPPPQIKNGTKRSGHTSLLNE